MVNWRKRNEINYFVVIGFEGDLDFSSGALFSGLAVILHGRFLARSEFSLRERKGNCVKNVILDFLN